MYLLWTYIYDSSIQEKSNMLSSTLVQHVGSTLAQHACFLIVIGTTMQVSNVAVSGFLIEQLV